MGVEFVCASALASLRSTAAPAAVHTAVLSRGVEEDASFAAQAAACALEQVAAYRTVLACELVDAARCLRMRGRTVAAALDELVAHTAVGGDELGDRDLTADIAVAERVLDEPHS
jgi:histidine ammonia-lyase